MKIVVPPKPSKAQCSSDDEYIAVVQAHSQAVDQILQAAAARLMQQGRAHDQDKVRALKNRDVEHNHRAQPHHWYAEHNDTLPTLFDIIEMCADTVATTAGKQCLDPWAEQWLPPLQDSEWWDDVIRRTELQISSWLEKPILNPKRPRDLPTKRVEDD